MFRGNGLPVRRMITVSAVLLVACGCGSDGSSTDAPTSSATAAPASPSVDSVAAAAPTTPVATESAATDTAASEASAADATADTMTIDMGDPVACLTGRWSLGAEQVQRTFDDTTFGSMPGASAVVSGEGILELAGDGTYTYTPAYTVALTVADQTAEGEWSGVQTGTWGVDGSTLTTAITTDGVTGSLTFLGNTMPLPEPVAFSGSAELVDCSPMTFETAVDSPIRTISNVFVFAD